MKTKDILIIFIFSSYILQAQIEAIRSKYDLPSMVSETSGLLFYNGKLITHNDSGDAPNLYEIDTLTGNISRTIPITNATNIDWEAISQDEEYLYIGDFGNNNGTRRDLKIYRILKSEYNNANHVSSEIISFSYDDQTDFSTNPYQHDFDAEAFVVYNEQIILFSKNWASNTVKAYSIPKALGTHTAQIIGTYDSQGLITDAAYNAQDNSLMLCGYTRQGSLFLLYLYDISIDTPFNGIIERTNITISIGLGSQIEGITNIEGNKYFLSREYRNIAINGIQLELQQHLFRFDNGSFNSLSVSSFGLPPIDIYPNPTGDILHISGAKIVKFVITDSKGSVLITKKNPSNQIQLDELNAGIYFVQISTSDQRTFTKQMMKY